MALHPSNFSGQERLQPGGRGNIFQTSIPGYRDNADRINRTNTKLNVSDHDVPNIKYQIDHRLPVLFKYGYAYGYNQIIIPKGRVVAVDPYMDLVDFDTHKQHNTLTLANGGVPVRLRKTGDLYWQPGETETVGEEALVSVDARGKQVHGIGKEWIPVAGMEAAYTANSMKAFKTVGPLAALKNAGYELDEKTGVVTEAGVLTNSVRPANIPIGIIQRNEYTRDDDAHNGMIPGPVLTDALVELPWFAYKDKAEQNPWGSAYGGLFPGALVKSDENGRITVSPLSFLENEVTSMSVTEYELERQQIIGQVYSAYNNLLPEGAAKWATWSLEDRMNFDEFNPETYRSNNRRGEDAINHSPYQSEGKYPGYPYEKAFTQHDLHMLASTGRLDNYSTGMNPEYQYENLGIPGLTDGHNAVVREYDAELAGRILYAGEGNDYVDMFFRTSEVDLEPNSLQISVGGDAFAPCTEGALIKDFLRVKYADEKQGIVVLEVIDKTKADEALKDKAGLEVKFKFNKRGLAGVPTFLDWDGAVGSVKILLTK